MKKLFIALLFVCNAATAQQPSKIELLSTIAKDICQDITENNVNVNSEQILGLYMIKNVNKHKEEVETFYGKDFFTNEASFESIGEEIGVYMGMTCPEVFQHFWADETAEETVEIKSVSGTITKIDNEQFLNFTVREDSGKKHQFILLFDFETAYLLTDELLKIKDQVEVSYYVSEMYDARIGKFVNYNIVSYIEKK